MSGNGQGTCYLIHFSRPVGDPTNPRGQARHYLGHAEDLEARLDTHAKGNGARLMEVLAELGVPWQLVRTWPGNYQAEKRLKRHHNSPRFCPICNPDGWQRSGRLG